jgi:nucleotide-binding universal stress UspA family protein
MAPVGTLSVRPADAPHMKVLLGIGGSEDSLTALDRTVERTLEAGDDLTVAVLDNPASDAAQAEVEREARERLDAADLDADVRVLEGDPGSELLGLAEREGFERIVIGGGETSPMGKVTLGSIAEFVLLNSHTSVTLVR